MVFNRRWSEKSDKKLTLRIGCLQAFPAKDLFCFGFFFLWSQKYSSSVDGRGLFWFSFSPLPSEPCCSLAPSYPFYQTLNANLMPVISEACVLSGK